MDLNQENQTDSSPETVESSTTEDGQSPRLRIHHLMLWMLCSAPMLTALKGLMIQSQLPDQFDRFTEISHLVYGIVGGAMFAGSIVLAYSRFRDKLPIVGQPGHWILLIQSFTLFIAIGVSFLSRVANDQITLSMILYSGMQLIPAVGYFLAARRATERRWRILFLGFFLLALVECLHYLSIVIGMRLPNYASWYPVGVVITELWGLILAIWLVVVVVIDQRRGLKRDWLHWTGVIGYLSLFGLGLLWQVVLTFMQ